MNATRRVSVWLSPDQVDRMERQGGEPWLGRIVKQLLESAVVEPARPLALVVPDPENGRVCQFEPEPAPVSDIAAALNEAGWHDKAGKPLVYSCLNEQWRAWKRAKGES